MDTNGSKKTGMKNQFMKKKMAMFRNKDRPAAVACYICGRQFLPVESGDERPGVNFQSFNEINGAMYAMCGNCARNLTNYIYDLRHKNDVEVKILANLEKLDYALKQQNNKADQISDFLERLAKTYGDNNDEQDLYKETNNAGV